MFVFFSEFTKPGLFQARTFFHDLWFCVLPGGAAAALEMHPLDTADRVSDLKKTQGIGYCNITKCCTVACPEHIKITDNAIIPLKERVVDEFYDPITKLFRMFKPKKRAEG